MQQMDKLEATIVHLIRTRPFYGSVINRMHIQLKDDLKEPAGVTIKNGKVYLLINKKLFDEMPLEQRKGVLEHEVHHLIDFHPIRKKNRDSDTWSYACDLAVNTYLPDTAPNDIHPDKINMPHDLAAEEYYVGLEERAAELQLTLSQLAKQLKGQFQLGIEANEMHEPWNDPDADDEELAKAVIIDIIKDAFNKNAGTLPGNLIRKIEDMVKSQVDWKQALRNIAASARASCWTFCGNFLRRQATT